MGEERNVCKKYEQPPGSQVTSFPPVQAQPRPSVVGERKKRKIISEFGLQFSAGGSCQRIELLEMKVINNSSGS
jgi:hypothetical protein